MLLLRLTRQPTRRAAGVQGSLFIWSGLNALRVKVVACLHANGKSDSLRIRLRIYVRRCRLQV